MREKSYAHEPVHLKKYKVLAVQALSPVEQVSIAARMVGIKLPEHARNLHIESPNWSFQWRDHNGSIGALKWRGVDVAVFYRRTINEITPLLEDPVPLATIQDPSDAWVMFSLLELSPRKVQDRTSTHVKELRTTRTMLTHENLAQDVQIEKLEAELYEAKQQLMALEGKPPERLKLCGTAEAAQILGVTLQAFTKMYVNNSLPGKIANLKQTPVWWQSDMEKHREILEKAKEKAVRLKNQQAAEKAELAAQKQQAKGKRAVTK